MWERKTKILSDSRYDNKCVQSHKNSYQTKISNKLNMLIKLKKWQQQINKDKIKWNAYAAYSWVCIDSVHFPSSCYCNSSSSRNEPAHTLSDGGPLGINVPATWNGDEIPLMSVMAESAWILAKRLRYSTFCFIAYQHNHSTTQSNNINNNNALLALL